MREQKCDLALTASQGPQGPYLKAVMTSFKHDGTVDEVLDIELSTYTHPTKLTIEENKVFVSYNNDSGFLSQIIPDTASAAKLVKEGDQLHVRMVSTAQDLLAAAFLTDVEVCHFQLPQGQ